MLKVGMLVPIYGCVWRHEYTVLPSIIVGSATSTH
jgi:hypothetical protein